MNGHDPMAELAEEGNSYRDNAVPYREAKALLQTKAKQLGLTSDDGVKAANDAYEYGARGDAETEEWAEARLETVRASDVEMLAVRWLWPGRVPRGKLSLLIGDPDVGKTTVAIDLAARLSRGATWPDGVEGQRGHVLFISTEDDPADTLKPRLIAAGADLSKVHFLQRAMRRDSDTEEMRPSAFTLEDIEALNVRLRRIGDVGAVILDPITAHLGKADANDNAQVRSLLWPLIKLAESRNFALIGIGHLNKAQGTAALYRALGSIGWVAAARAVYLCARDPEDEKGERRLFLRLKNNLSKDRGGLAFTLSEKRVDGPSITAPRIDWQDGEVRTTAAQALAEPEMQRESRRSEVEAKLKEMLAGGPIPAKEGVEQLLEEGFSRDTIFRARDALKVTSKREREGFVWSLPKLKLKLRFKNGGAS